MKERTYQILLAEDDFDDCRFFCEAMEGTGFETNISIVHDGEQVMSLLKDSIGLFPDLIFLDLRMPRKSGLQCIEEIKADSRYSDLRMIVLTSSADHMVEDYLYKKGVLFYLEKPADQDMLVRLLKQIMEATLCGDGRQPLREQFLVCTS